MQLDLAVSKLLPVHTDKYNILTEVVVVFKGFVWWFLLVRFLFFFNIFKLSK